MNCIYLWLFFSFMHSDCMKRCFMSNMRLPLFYWFFTFKQKGIFVQFFFAESLRQTRCNLSLRWTTITNCHTNCSYQCPRGHSWMLQRPRSPAHSKFGSTPRSCGQRWTRWRWLTTAFSLCWARWQLLCCFQVDFSRCDTHAQDQDDAIEWH